MYSLSVGNSRESLDLIICYISVLQKACGYIDTLLSLLYCFSSVLRCKHSLTETIKSLIKFLQLAVHLLFLHISEIFGSGYACHTALDHS